MAVSNEWLQQIDRFRRERSGQVALLFGLMFIPLACTVGAGIDYARKRNAQVRLDAALDAAVLSIASRKANVFDPVEVQRTLDTQFRAQAATVPQTTVLDGTRGFKVTVVPTTNDVTIRAEYSAVVGTTLTRLMKFDGMSVAGSASAARNFARYMDFYLLLDNSPSMGLAATAADITKMEKLTQTQSSGDSAKGIPNRRSCAFACHETPRSGAAEDYADNYWFAKNNGIKLRIDNLRDAAAGLVDRADASDTLPEQFRMAIYTFNDDVSQLSGLTLSYTDTKAKALGIDLVRSYSDLSDKQTSYIKVLPKIADIIPASGAGLTKLAPIRMLFFVTDGAQDSPLFGKTINSAYDKVSSYDAVGGAGVGRFMGALDPTLCDSFKAKQIKVAVLYTKYYPVVSDGWYNTYIAPFDNTIPTNLRACASEGLYSEVSVDGDISSALAKLFDTAVSSVRLTN